MKTRRSFLKQLFTTSVVCLVNPISLFSQQPESKAEDSVPKPNKDTSDKVRRLKQEAREAFHKRNNEESTKLYNDLITAYPEDITNYDGLKRILASQNKQLEIVRLYQNGLSKNPELPVFYDRLAKSLMSLATGNEKDLNGYDDRENIYVKALSLYVKAIEIAPQHKYLYLELSDVWDTINKRNKKSERRKELLIIIPDEIKEKICTLTEKHEQEWKISRSPRKPNNKINEDFGSYTSRVVSKERRTLYFNDEKTNRETNILRMKRRYVDKAASLQLKQGKFPQLLLLLISALSEKNFSTNALGLLKKGLKSKEHFNSFRLFYEALYTGRKDTWGLIGKGLSYKRCGFSPNKVLDIFLQAENNIDVYSAKKLAAIYENQADIYFKLKNYAQGEAALRKGMELLQDSGTSVALMIKYAQGYALQGQYTKAVELLNYITNDGDMQKDNMNLFHQLPSKGSEDYVKEEYLKIYYALSKIQYKQHDLPGLNNTLENINKIDYENRFVQKMKTQLS